MLYIIDHSVFFTERSFTVEVKTDRTRYAQRLTSNSYSERQTEFGFIIQMGNNCLGPKVRLIGVV